MNLSEMLTLYAAKDREAKAAKAAMSEMRADIDAEHRAEYERTGTLPSFKVPGVCSSRLQGGEPEITVSDAETFAEWCAEHYPDAVTFVVKIPRKRVDSDEFQRIWAKLQQLCESTESEVKPYVLETLAAEGTADTESGRLVLEGGEVVEGVRVWKTEPGLWIVPVKPK